MKPGTFHVDSFELAPLPPSEDTGLDQAMLRAYTVERLVDYGCTLDDVLKMHRRTQAGHSWSAVALQLATDNEARAVNAAREGHSELSMRLRLHAAACCRIAQAGLEHAPESRVLAYARQASNFDAAMKSTLSSPPEQLEVLAGALPHRAWLYRAPELSAGGAAVVVWGGADGWCEAFHTSVPFYLERGLSVCLLELPGQGMARLRHGSVLTPKFTQVVSHTLDALMARGADSSRLGVVGHSAGGSFAIAAAAADERIRACCSNGGSAHLKQGLTEFPRVLQRFGRMLGDNATDKDVLDFLDTLDLPRAARQMRASLLVLHGGRDPLVSEDHVRHLVALRGAEAARLELWPEGIHCLYNHAIERNCVLTDWLAQELREGAPPSIPFSSE